MRAAVLYGPGAFDAFVLEQVPIPQIDPDDALVRVKACGVSYRDIVERNGTYRRDVTFPLIIGIEISGQVVATGALVSDLAVGDHVCTKAFSSCGRCRLCRTGRESTCLKRQPVRGGYAEYVALPQDAFVKVSDEIPYEKSCGLGPGAGVALNAVRDAARISIGETVLITGASGGVGIPAVQIAKAAGAKVIASTRNESKRAILRECGADEVLVGPADDRLVAEVRRITRGSGVDVVLDTVGSAVFHAAFNSLAVHGRYAVIGQLNADKTSINLARIFFKRAAIIGVGSVSRVQLEDAAELTVRGIVRPQISRILPLEQVAEAHRLVEEGAIAGRVVLQP